MSSVTAVLECPGCEEILESEERPNINWKLGTTRIVLVPTAKAVAHVYECTGIHEKFCAVLASLDINDLEEWQKRFLVTPHISVVDQPVTAEVLEVEGVTTIQGTPDGLVFLDETSTLEADQAKTQAETEVPADESTEKKTDPDPAVKPAAKKRTTK